MVEVEPGARWPLFAVSVMYWRPNAGGGHELGHYAKVYVAPDCDTCRTLAEADTCAERPAAEGWQTSVSIYPVMGTHFEIDPQGTPHYWEVQAQAVLRV